MGRKDRFRLVFQRHGTGWGRFSVGVGREVIAVESVDTPTVGRVACREG